MSNSLTFLSQFLKNTKNPNTNPNTNISTIESTILKIKNTNIIDKKTKKLEK